MATGRGKPRGSGAKADGPGDQKNAAGTPLDAEVDALFKLPLANFTAARNTLAGRLRKAGRREEADAVQAITKPSISAWAINQVYWTDRPAFDRLIASGQRFYDAQMSQLSGQPADVRGGLEARREALSEVSRLAAGALRAAGSNPTPEMMRRVTTTLEALSTFGSSVDIPHPGRLIDDIEPAGFDVLAPLVSRMGDTRAEGPSRVLSFRQQRPATARSRRTLSPEDAARAREDERHAARAAATALVEQAGRSVREAREAVQRAESALKKAAARAKETEQEKEEAEQRFRQAAAVAEQAHTDARRVATEAEEAAQTLDEAERTLEQARRELEKLS